MSVGQRIKQASTRLYFTDSVITNSMFFMQRIGSFGPSIWRKYEFELNHVIQFSATVGLKLPSVSSFSCDVSVCAKHSTLLALNNAYLCTICQLIKLMLLKRVRATLIFHDFKLTMNSCDRFILNMEIPLTNRVRGPYRKLRTEFFSVRFMAQARAINRRGKTRIRNRSKEKRVNLKSFLSS